MAQTTAVDTLPPQIALEFHQVEPPPDEDARPIEIGDNGSITSSDRLCVVEIHNMGSHSQLSPQGNFPVAGTEQLPIHRRDKWNVPANFKLGL